MRGRRIATPDNLKHIRVTSEAVRIDPIITAPLMALPLLVVLLVVLLGGGRKKKKHPKP